MTGLPAGITITAMTDEHASQVLAIYDQGIAEGNASFEPGAPDWSTFSSGKLSQHRFVAIDEHASYGSEVLGWVALSPTSARHVYRGVVEESIYLAPAARGRGLGRALLEAVIASSEAAGIWMLRAGIFPENEASIALHRSVGFRIVGTHERIGAHIPPGHSEPVWRDVVLMERRSPVI